MDLVGAVAAGHHLDALPARILELAQKTAQGRIGNLVAPRMGHHGHTARTGASIVIARVVRGTPLRINSSPGSTAVASSELAPHVYIHGRIRPRYSAIIPAAAINPAKQGRCFPMRRG